MSNETLRIPGYVITVSEDYKLAAIGYGLTLNVHDLAAGGKLLKSFDLLKDFEPNKKRSKNPQENADPIVRAIAFSKDNKKIAFGGDDKVLRAWDLSEDKLICAKSIPKRVTEMHFDKKDRVVFADKFGDVFKVNLYDGKEDVADEGGESECILGHISTISCMKLDPECKVIVTGDRDEKVRISRYPDAYNIITYCLGHKSSILGITFCNPDILCSGAADGFIKLWDWKNGGSEVFSTEPCKEGSDGENAESVVIPADYHSKTQIVAVLAEEKKSVWLYKFLESEKKLELVKKLDMPAVPTTCKFVEDGSLLVAFHYSEECPSERFAVVSADGELMVKGGLDKIVGESAPLAEKVEDVVKMEKEFECENMKRTIFPRQRGGEECEPAAKKVK